MQQQMLEKLKQELNNRQIPFTIITSGSRPFFEFMHNSKQKKFHFSATVKNPRSISNSVNELRSLLGKQKETEIVKMSTFKQTGNTWVLRVGLSRGFIERLKNNGQPVRAITIGRQGKQLIIKSHPDGYKMQEVKNAGNKPESIIAHSMISCKKIDLLFGRRPAQQVAFDWLADHKVGIFLPMEWLKDNEQKEIVNKLEEEVNEGEPEKKEATADDLIAATEMLNELLVSQKNHIAVVGKDALVHIYNKLI